MNIRKFLACLAVALCAGGSLFAVTPTPTPTATPTPHAVSLTDTSVYKGGTSISAILRAIDDGHGAFVPAFILVDTNGDPVSLGGGSGGLTNTELRASPVPVSGPLTDTQLRATAVPISIDQSTPGMTNAVAITGGAQYTVAISNTTHDGTIDAGKHHVEFILSSDFEGTIQSVDIDPAIVAIYNPGDAPVGSTFDAFTYTIAAGNATITTW